MAVLRLDRLSPPGARLLCVVKPRGSAMSDEIVEYRITPNGLEM